jgi:uncharacterized protein
MRVLFILSFCLIGITSFARQKKTASPFIKNLPVPHRAVNDFGKFLTVSEKQYLEKELVGYFNRTSNAIVIITLDSLTDPKTKKEYTVEETALLYFNKWGIGDSIKNNGVLLLLSRKPHRVRIEVGKGLENVLTNAVCQQIVDDKLVPAFKEGLFFTGIKEAVTAIEAEIEDTTAAKKDKEGIAALLTPVQSHPDNEIYKQNPVSPGLVIAGTFSLAFLIWLFAKYGKLRGHSGEALLSSGSHIYDNGWGSSSSSDSTYSSSGGSSSGGSSSGFGGGSSSGGGASGSW